MGFNTTVVILNDMLSEIENDPGFGKKLAAAIRSFSRNNPERMPYVTGQTQVIGCHHADGMMVFAVGGNTGREIGYGGSYRSTNDDIIKELERARKWRVKEDKRKAAEAERAAFETDKPKPEAVKLSRPAWECPHCGPGRICVDYPKCEAGKIQTSIIP